MHLLVDPIVLCLPEQTATTDQIEQFFECLNDWSELIRSQQDIGDDEFFISGMCCDALMQSQRYPYLHLIRPLLTTANLPFDAKTVFMACSRIISNLPYFEEKASIPLNSLLVYGNNMYLNPDLIRRISQTKVAESLRETLGYVAYAKEISQHPIAEDLIFLTHPVKDSEVLTIDATLESKQDGECKVTTNLPIVERPEDLYRLKGLQDIWQDTDKAISWAIDDLKRKKHIDEQTEVFPCTVAPEFNQSLSEYQFHTHPDRLAQCFLKIARLLTENTHRRTETNHPLESSTKRTVDGREWEAWRLHITGGKTAFRLHYWWSEGEYILSKVGPHNDYTIGPIPES